MVRLNKPLDTRSQPGAAIARLRCRADQALINRGEVEPTVTWAWSDTEATPMGICITSIETDPIPRRNVIELACDTIGCASVMRVTGCYIEARRKMTDVGWSETNKRGKREFICPACNGTAPTADLFSE